MRHDIIVAHGLSLEEYALARARLGREVTLAELGVIGAMWSEHCSYKSSRIHLERFYSHNHQVIEGPGENAGVVRLDEEGKWALAFKMESHNHPSQIEPVQGAATGVGGILRDIFAMGARPIALMNSLRFGRPEAPRMQHLIHGVVEGISSYGNCIGVPNVGGETQFDACYDQNILVNVFALGLVEQAKLKRAAAPHAGCVLVYYGARTGRDGIHGATMASEQFGEDVQDRRPAVQVGDPFQGKLVMEATLELVEHDLVLAVQDMGAAGLTSSSVEMAHRGGVGVRLDLDAVPCREAEMTAREMLLSESQERMLAVIHREDLPHVEQIVREKWELDCAVIGELTRDSLMVATRAGEVEVCLPVALLTSDAPCYDRPVEAPKALPEPTPFELRIERPEALQELALDLLRQPDVVSKRWVYERYDSEVGLRTLERSGEAAAAVMWIQECEAKIALSVDCRARLVCVDPRKGAMHAVAECARNLSCTGATPRAMTDCLNFGDPTIPQVMWQFAEATRGLDEAARALDIPIVSGNVSLYNASKGKSIDPTPTVAMVGVFESREKRHASLRLRNNEACLCVLKVANWSKTLSLEGSELARMLGEDRAVVSHIELDAERALHETIRGAIARGDVSVAQDCSQGGLWVALVELVLSGVRRKREGQALGLRLDMALDEGQGLGHAARLLFAESASQIVFTCDLDAFERLRRELARERLLVLDLIGQVVERKGISWPNLQLAWSEEALWSAHEA